LYFWGILIPQCQFHFLLLLANVTFGLPAISGNGQYPFHFHFHSCLPQRFALVRLSPGGLQVPPLFLPWLPPLLAVPVNGSDYQRNCLLVLLLLLLPATAIADCAATGLMAMLGLRLFLLTVLWSWKHPFYCSSDCCCQLFCCHYYFWLPQGFFFSSCYHISCSTNDDNQK
jgi:hypothetical protein